MAPRRISIFADGPSAPSLGWRPSRACGDGASDQSMSLSFLFFWLRWTTINQKHALLHINRLPCWSGDFWGGRKMIGAGEISVGERTTPGFVAELREDLLLHDPLLACLCEVARIHGRQCSQASLTAGLPLQNGRLTAALFPRAAARAGLSCRILRRKLRDINDILLPVVLLLKNDQASILCGWNTRRDTARLLWPEAGQGAVEMPADELAALYVGVSIFSRPQYAFDARAPEITQVTRRHWFWGSLFQQASVYRDVVFAAIMTNLFALAMPFFTMNVYDRVVPNNAVDTLWALALGVMLAIVMDFAVRVMRGRFVDLAGARVDLELSALLMERVLGVRMEQRPVSVGAFAANLRSFDSVRDFIASSSVAVLTDFPFALLFLTVIAWIHWPLAVIPVVGLITGMIYADVVRRRVHELMESGYRASAQRNATLVEGLTALETIKTLSAETVIQRKWEEASEFLARTNAQVRHHSAKATNVASAISQFVNVGLVVAGVYLIQEHQLSIGGVIAVTMLGARTMSPLGQAVGMLLQFQNARMSLETLDSLMKLPVERPGNASFIHRPRLFGEIDFSEASFRYPGRSEAVLRNVSFHIMPGEHVVVLGRVGSGKSTLAKLILGLYQPTAGAIRIDGIDLRQLDPADLRRNIAYVGQDPELFFGTIRENIAMSMPHAEDAMVVSAAELAGLSSFVNRHPMGFDMPIGERGESLSGGQRQQVAIARAVMMNPPLLVFDEPTSGMDFSTENDFKQRLRNYAAGKTLLIVTHRSSLIDLATRIIVMDAGQIIANGPRDQVVQALREGRIGKRGQ